MEQCIEFPLDVSKIPHFLFSCLLWIKHIRAKQMFMNYIQPVSAKKQKERTTFYT